MNDNENLRNFEMPFGKHKGLTMREIPRNYLEWILKNCDKLHPKTKESIDAYLDLPVLPDRNI